MRFFWRRCFAQICQGLHSAFPRFWKRCTRQISFALLGFPLETFETFDASKKKAPFWFFFEELGALFFLRAGAFFEKIRAAQRIGKKVLPGRKGAQGGALPEFWRASFSSAASPRQGKSFLAGKDLPDFLYPFLCQKISFALEDFLCARRFPLRQKISFALEDFLCAFSKKKPDWYGRFTGMERFSQIW